MVAGAGPSGATAAYYLAKQGKSVAFVDRAKFPREKACGGGLCVHIEEFDHIINCLLYTSPSPRDQRGSGMAA